MSDLTPEIIAAFGEAFYTPPEGKVAFIGLVKKLKKLTEVFAKVPQLWTKFKQLIGIESLTDIPGALKKLAEMAVKALRQVFHKMFDTWPLKLYTLGKEKLGSFNDLLGKLMAKFPTFKRWVDAGVGKVADFGESLRKKAPRLTGLLMVAIYLWVWVNVVEFEWDFKSFADALSGAMTFPDFLASLPGSAFGFLLNFLKLGTFTLLPYTVAARIIYLVANRYVSWTGRGFTVDWARLRSDFGVENPAVTPAPA